MLVYPSYENKRRAIVSEELQMINGILYLFTIFAKRINLSGITIQLRIALFDNLKSFILFNLLCH